MQSQSSSCDDHVLSVTIIQLNGDVSVIMFQPRVHRNLMEMIVNELYEDIGDCKGRAWCGTCHVAIQSGRLVESQTRDEQATLSGLDNATTDSRLACQIMADEGIDGMTFKVLGDV